MSKARHVKVTTIEEEPKLAGRGGISPAKVVVLVLVMEAAIPV